MTASSPLPGSERRSPTAMEFEAFCRSLESWRSSRGAEAASLVALRKVPSSHRLARRILREYSAEESRIPAVDLVAWEQVEGHGREGRSWSSPPGAGLYVSLVRPLRSALISTLPMAVPVVLASAVGERISGACRVKWPNDLVVGERKLGGILIDIMSQGESRGAVISFGLNVASDLSPFTAAASAPSAITSIGALAPEADPAKPAHQILADLFCDLLDRLNPALAESLAGEEGSEARPWIDRYRALSAHHPGDRVRWRHRGRLVEGNFLGFDGSGHLLLEIEGEEQRITAGDILASREKAADDGH
ncbi:MAG: biotin--[acetyl-CoA-carboxylase] ligase [Acidobacteriota bacterium]